MRDFGDQEKQKMGEIVEGEIFEMSNLTQDPFASELKNRILNTKEQFVFTYRGTSRSNNDRLFSRIRHADESSVWPKLQFKC